MTTNPKPSEAIQEPALEVPASPEMIQDYITCMLRELSDMAHTSGLTQVSSLLQVSLLAVRTNSQCLE